MTHQTKFFEMFAGIGGFRLGLERQGFKCVGSCEIDKHAQKLYHNFYNTQGEHFEDDATKINPEELPDFDMLVGGFPCQAFSIAGKRKGFEDTRGTLFFEIARIASIKKPKVIFLENVKGLLSHNGGDTFETIITTLWELGYSVEWNVFNSKHFGVPQNRERVFIIGHLRGCSERKIFPISGDNKKASFVPRQIANTLRARQTSDTVGTFVVESEQYAQIKQINNPKHSNDRVYDPIGLSPTLNTMQGGRRQPLILLSDCLENNVDEKYFIKKPFEDYSKNSQGNKLCKNDECFHTINAGTHGYSMGYIEDTALNIRRLTPLECFRLQGFPDDMVTKARELNISDTQLYKMAGNAVTVNVIEAIAKEIRKNKELGE